MRSPIKDAYAWHSRALTGEMVDIHPDEPQAGWYKVKMVKDGVFVPVVIRLIQDIDEAGDLVNPIRFEAERNGKSIDAHQIWTYAAKNPISEEDFNYMTDRKAWAETNAPHMPEANPTKKINHKDIPPLF